MSLMDRLRAMAEATPAGGMISLPVDWLRSELSTEEPAALATPQTGDLTVEQLAEEQGRSPSTIRGWLGEGLFPNAYKLRGRDWRIPRSDVRAFLEAQERPASEAQATPRRRERDSDDLSSWRRMQA